MAHDILVTLSLLYTPDCPTMKLHLPLGLLTALSLLAATAATATAATSFTPSDNLGNVMYVGDSITHGVDAATYRWALHKILVDNGVSQNEVGVMTGNDPKYLNGSAIGTGGATYGGVAFSNVHSAQSSARTYEISGRWQRGRFGNTNILDWLGVDSSYSGSYQIDTATEMPATYFLMSGTNDFLSDANTKYISTATGSTSFATVQQNLLGTYADGKWSGDGDLDVIINAMREASGEDATIILTTIPTWSPNHGNNNKAEDFQLVVKEYNDNLTSWARQNGVTIIDVNKGMIDVANTTHIAAGETQSYAGLPWQHMYRQSGNDGLHPNAQGDLLIAGNIARQLGYAGRTAGQRRVAGAELELQAAELLADSKTISVNEDSTITLGSGDSFTYTWEATADTSLGYTVTFSLENGLGDGALNGWNTQDAFTVQLGNGTLGGTLSVDEAYVKWGESIIWSEDMSTLSAGTAYGANEFRVAYVVGNTDEGLESGFYVWMGDMLVGEALEAQAGQTLSGISMSNASASSITLSGLAADASGACAPVALGATYGNPLIAPAVVSNVLEGKEMPSSGDIRSGLGVETGNVLISISSGSTSALRVNTGNYVGNVDVTLTGTATLGSAWGALHQNGTLSGNVSLTVDEQYAPSESKLPTIIGVVTGTVTGDVSMEFASDKLSLGTGTYSGVQASLAGTYRSSVGGTISMDIKAGSFASNIYGGSINQASANEGIGATAITLTGGRVAGNIYGGGAYGTIGSTAVTIDGAATVAGSLISAGGDNVSGQGGLITGTTNLTLRDISQQSTFYSYGGTLSGGFRAADGKSGAMGTRTLVLHNVVVPKLNATLQDFDEVKVEGSSNLALADLGGARSLSVESGCKLELTAAAGGRSTHTMADISLAGTLIISQGVSLSAAYTGDTQVTAGGVYELNGGLLTFQDASGNDVDAAGTVRIYSGTLTGASRITGGIYVSAHDDVTITRVNAASLMQLDALSGCSITLQEAVATLSGSAGAAAFHICNGALVTVANTLTLTLDAEMTMQALSALATAPAAMDADALSSTPVGYLLLAEGTLKASEDLTIQLNLDATTAQGYRLVGTGITTLEDGMSYVTYTLDSASVPEPATALLSLLGLAGMATRRRRR